MISADMIKARFENFWGYGSLAAPFWFVGMEEGLDADTSEEELFARMKAGHGKKVIDLRKDMAAVPGHLRWFQPYIPGRKPPLQRTWNYLIAFYLCPRSGIRLTPGEMREEIRRYLGTRFADMDAAETAALELMPLPCQRADDGIRRYAKYGVPHVENRETYLQHYKRDRVDRLRSLIFDTEAKPKVVLFYGLGYRGDWEPIIGSDLKPVRSQMLFARNKDVSFVVTPQPIVRGLTRDNFLDLADAIRDRVSLDR